MAPDPLGACAAARTHLVHRLRFNIPKVDPEFPAKIADIMCGNDWAFEEWARSERAKEEPKRPKLVVPDGAPPFVARAILGKKRKRKKRRGAALKGGGTSVARARRWFFNQAQDGRCYLVITMECERRAGDLQGVATWDHVLPRSKGGKTAGNVLLACWECNTTKGSREIGLDSDAGRAAEIWESFRVWFDAMTVLRELSRLTKPAPPKPRARKLVSLPYIPD